MTPADRFVAYVKRYVAEGDDQGLRAFYAGICKGARRTEQPTLRGAILEAREPLVQEVIRLSKQLGELHDQGALEGLKNATLFELHHAVRALADWSPT